MNKESETLGGMCVSSNIYGVMTGRGLVGFGGDLSDWTHVGVKG